MKTMAVVCEYNPFHNGHLYQITEHKKELSCDSVIALMSGNFVQRGDAAICDKWARAKMALSCGCDLVLELPVVFAAQSAERFAYGAVSLIDKLGVAEYLSFGSECGDVETLSLLAELFLTDSFQVMVKDELKQGVSYPRARASALAKALGDTYKDIIDKPNNILALEYIKALKLQKSEVVPKTLHRFQAPYHSTQTYGKFASATAIRRKIEENMDYLPYLPAPAAQILSHEITIGKAPVSLAPLEATLLYLLRTMPLAHLRNIGDVTEGMESRLKEGARKCGSVAELSDFVKTKRYTQTRINRVFINILLGITKDALHHEPQYIRVLGLNERGAKLLSSIKKISPLPIITKTAHIKSPTSSAQAMLEKDILATDVYALLYPNQAYNVGGLDFLTSPVMV